MSNPIVQYFRNFSDWRAVTVTLPIGEFKSIADLLSAGDLAAIGERPVIGVDFLFAEDTQIVDMSHEEDPDDDHIVGLEASVGPGRWIGPPVINSHKKVFLRHNEGGTLKILLYIG